MVKKLTKRKLKAFIRDERMASAEYKKYGLKMLSRDEASHKKFLEKKIKG